MGSGGSGRWKGSKGQPGTEIAWRARVRISHPPLLPPPPPCPLPLCRLNSSPPLPSLPSARLLRLGDACRRGDAITSDGPRGEGSEKDENAARDGVNASGRRLFTRLRHKGGGNPGREQRGHRAQARWAAIFWERQRRTSNPAPSLLPDRHLDPSPQPPHRRPHPTPDRVRSASIESTGSAMEGWRGDTPPDLLIRSPGEAQQSHSSSPSRRRRKPGPATDDASEPTAPVTSNQLPPRPGRSVAKSPPRDPNTARSSPQAVTAAATTATAAHTATATTTAEATSPPSPQPRLRPAPTLA